MAEAIPPLPPPLPASFMSDYAPRSAASPSPSPSSTSSLAISDYVQDWTVSDVENFIRSLPLEIEEVEHAVFNIQRNKIDGKLFQDCLQVQEAVKLLGITAPGASTVSTMLRIKLNKLKKTAPPPLKIRIKISVVELLKIQDINTGTWQLSDQLALNLGIDLKPLRQKLQTAKQTELTEDEERAVATALTLDVILSESKKKKNGFQVAKLEINSGKADSQVTITQENVQVTQKNIEDLIAQNKILAGKEKWKQNAESFLAKNPIPKELEVIIQETYQLIESRGKERKTCEKCNQSYSANRPKCPYCNVIEIPIITRETKPEDLFHFDPENAFPADIFKEIDWDHVNGVHRIAGGTGSISGVFFIDTDDGVFVLKFGGLNSSSEYFCSSFLSMFSIKTPKIRLLSHDEFSVYLEELKDVNYSRDEERDYVSLAAQKVAPVFLMDYIPGDVLLGLEKIEYLKDPQVLYEIGRILACDVLINNYDRLPLIWENQGNPGNLIFRKEEEGKTVVYAIDQCVTAIKDRDAIVAYLEKVSKAIDEAKSRKAGECFKAVVQSLSSNTGIQIGNEYALKIQEGFLGGIKTICLILESEKSHFILEKMKEKTRQDFQNKGYSAEASLDMIDPDFLEPVLQVYRNCLSN